MADKTLDQLTALTTAEDVDLLAVYDVSASVLKKMQWSVAISAIAADLSGAYLAVNSNLSDLASASSARANLGLGTAATLASSAVFQVSNNFSEVANAATARTNIGAAASTSPTITGGMTFSGSTKQNVQAVAASDLDWSVAEFQTKSISSNTTFTFSGFTASKAQALIVQLTISSSAQPTWPASVTWPAGEEPAWRDGTHVIGLMTFDGGTTVRAFIGGLSFG